MSKVASARVFANASGGSEIIVTDGTTTDLTVSASTACVHCTRSITGNASGASTLTVSGNPGKAEVDASGGSRLVKEN